MTNPQYQNRRRLPGCQKPRRFQKPSRFSSEDLFEVMTLRGEIVYIKITAQWSQSLFDLSACYPNGTLIQGGETVGMVQMHQIQERLEENDWRWLGPAADYGKN